MAKSKIAVYPGTFDPVTFGHLDVIRRARKIFDEVIVAVAENDAKNPLFSVEERLKLLEKATEDMQGVRIDSFNTLVVNYIKSVDSEVIIRGVRMFSDFEFEFQMALTNRKLWDKVETIFLMPSEAYSYVSARLIKEAASLGADVSSFVPPHVVDALCAKQHGQSRVR